LFVLLPGQRQALGVEYASLVGDKVQISCDQWGGGYGGGDGDRIPADEVVRIVQFASPDPPGPRPAQETQPQASAVDSAPEPTAVTAAQRGCYAVEMDVAKALSVFRPAAAGSDDRAAAAVPGDGANEHKADAGQREPVAPAAKPEWTPPNSPQHWAKLFDFSVDTLKRRFKDKTIRHKKLSSKSYQIAVDDLPAIHQSKFRNQQNPPIK